MVQNSPLKFSQPQKTSPKHIHPKHKMYNLNTTSTFQVTTPAVTYVYEIVPISSGIATISSDNVLRLLDPLALDRGPVNSIQNVHSDVTCMKALETSPGDAAIVATAGRDGRVCLLDPRSGGKIGEVRSGELKI